MRRGRARRRVPRCLTWAAALVVAAAVVGLLAGHVLHHHPHRPGQVQACSLCIAPLATAPAPPALAPPTARVRAVALPRLAAARLGRAPLSFSPKQSPPA